MTHADEESPGRALPRQEGIPRHIAIIMDGNGRWARKRLMPRVAGHQRGVESVRRIIRACIDQGVEYLTLFAFSSENWRRPADEVSFLMRLFIRSLKKEIDRLHKNGIRFRVIGDISRFDDELVQMIRGAESLTAENTRFSLTIAANYGGRWDIMQAIQKMLTRHPGENPRFSEEDLAAELSMSFAPEPDLFIRTGGEQRVSNFLLWQLAYTELFFTDVLWPDFDAKMLKQAIVSYQTRERRFGHTSEQVRSGANVRGASSSGDAGKHA